MRNYYYEVGKVYIWQNVVRADYLYLNGQETVVIGTPKTYKETPEGAPVVAQMTDTPSNLPGKYLAAQAGRLRRKDPPPGEQTITDLFKEKETA